MRVDAEIPEDEIVETAGKYRDILNHYRQHSREFLDSGDYLQGAEKSWGAYAASIKAVAADYGLKITFHGSIISVASRLATLANQDGPRRRNRPASWFTLGPQSAPTFIRKTTSSQTL